MGQAAVVNPIQVAKFLGPRDAGRGFEFLDNGVTESWLKTLQPSPVRVYGTTLRFGSIRLQRSWALRYVRVRTRESGTAVCPRAFGPKPRTFGR